MQLDVYRWQRQPMQQYCIEDDALIKRMKVISLRDTWVLCPICKNKTRIKIRLDTVLENFPLFCPKCKQETLIRVKELNTTVIKEPDA